MNNKNTPVTQEIPKISRLSFRKQDQTNSIIIPNNTSLLIQDSQDNPSRKSGYYVDFPVKETK